MRYISNIERALDSVEAHLRIPVSIPEIARKSGFSYWHFQRIFAALVGEPIGSYIRRRRLTEAAVELGKSEKRILDIALDYQFESHEAFTRAFSAVFHVSPSEFRRTRPFVAGFARRRLDADGLAHLGRLPAMRHSILTLPELTLIGIEGRFISALSPDADNFKVIPALWHSLVSRQEEIGKRLDGFSYGAAKCLPAEHRKREDELVYLAGLSVDPRREVPAGMARWVIPAQTYVQFVHKGPIQRLPDTINHIYGVWLPRSEYQPTDAAEVERYDDRFDPTSEKSEMEFLVPIRPRAA